MWIPEQLQTVETDCMRITFASYPYSDTVNDSSIVVRLDYGATSFLFTGDIEGPAESFLVDKAGALLATDVVKVAHHGSRTSSSREFVERAASKPGREIAIVSVGRRNRFGHPHADALERWENYADVRTTAERGGIWIRSDGHKVSVYEWKEGDSD